MNQSDGRWRDMLPYVIHVANRAPSLHNTQPWLWRSLPDGVQLFADDSRWLSATDPDHHGQIVSCGATLRLAATAAQSVGFATEITYGRKGADPLATIQGRYAETVPESVVEIVKAAQQRISDRRPLDGAPVSRELLEHLATGAAPRTGVLLLQPHEHQVVLSVLTDLAENAELADPRYRHELARWTTPQPGYLDGVPTSAMDPTDIARKSTVSQRDFRAGGMQRPSWDATADNPALLAVMTYGNGTADWLAAGETLMHVTVEAQRHGLASCPLSQPVDHPMFRSQLAQELNAAGIPQILLRVGVPVAGVRSPLTPRRSVDEVLDVDHGLAG